MKRYSVSKTYAYKFALFVAALLLGLGTYQTSSKPIDQCISWEDCETRDEGVAMTHRSTGSPLIYDSSASLVSYDTGKVVSLGSAGINYTAAVVDVGFWYLVLNLTLKRVEVYRVSKSGKFQPV